LAIAVSCALGWILWPFYGTIMWGAIIALLFAPLYRRLLPRLKGRRTLAALLILLLVLVIVILPFVLITIALANEATLIYQGIQSGELNPALYFREMYAALPGWVSSLLDRFGLVNFDVLQKRLALALTQASQFFATQAFNIGQNTFDFIASVFIALYLAFFLIRDGDAVAKMLQNALPLTAPHKKELVGQFTTVIRATVKGNLLVASIQGALGGAAFWFLDVRGALLWGVLMAFLSLLPAIGAGLVWVPVAIYFLITGAIWQSIALTAYGVLVIGLVDNLLRPLLVGKDTGMPDYVVMITTLGGMAVLGLNGFVIGPVIAAMFIAVWHIYITTRPGEVS
jgi:predicted PurR-regulated permease PerM